MSKSAFIFAVCFIALSFCFCSSDVSGQTPDQEKPEAVNGEVQKADEEIEEDGETEDIPKEKRYMNTLETILQDMTSLKRQIRNKEKELRRTKTEGEQADIKEELDNLSKGLRILESDFEKISTGIDLSIFEEKTREAFKWEEELSELLRPVVHEMKKMTARPRQIEKLRSDIAYYTETLPVVKKAIENIESLISQAESKKLAKELKELKKTWSNQEQQISNQLASANLQLEELSAQKKPFLESAHSILKVFFKSRGRNLILSLLTFMAVFLILRLFHRGIYKVSPIHKAEERPFYIRLCDVIYHIMTAVGSVLAMLFVLYISGDWVLMTIAVVFILGFFWAAKQNLPKFWQEIKLLLNIGSVRENERLMYNGIPWKVVSLNLYTELENPNLKSRIRLPLNELIGFNSYPYDKNSPWFPCKEKDWVILADDTRGEVVSQTHEMVRLALRGGAFKTYLTDEFLRLNPLNLSGQFRLKVTFGVDYKHQAISAREIPEKLGEVLIRKLKEDGFGDNLINLRVDFKSAAASSLDMEVIADFRGKEAPLYSRLAREIQRFSVEACNEHGWEIPFSQITVHYADAGES